MGDIPVGNMNIPRASSGALLAALLPRRRRVLGSARPAAPAQAGMSQEDWQNAEEYARAVHSMGMEAEAQKHSFGMERILGEGAVKAYLATLGTEGKIAEARAKGAQDRASIRAKSKAELALLAEQNSTAESLYNLISEKGGEVRAGAVSASFNKKAEKEEKESAASTIPDNATRSQAFSEESPNLGVVDTPGQDNDEQPRANVNAEEPAEIASQCSQHSSKCTNRGKYKDIGYCTDCGADSKAYCDKHFYAHYDEAHT